jgi:hypothetical protein
MAFGLQNDKFTDLADDADDTRPELPADEGDLPAVTPRAWNILVAANIPPRLFRHGSTLVRMEHADDGAAVLYDLTPGRLKYEMARVAKWMKPTNGGRIAVPPPDMVIEDMLATPEPPLPVLTRIVAVPVFGPKGELQTEPGYHAAGRTYYDPP